MKNILIICATLFLFKPSFSQENMNLVPGTKEFPVYYEIVSQDIAYDILPYHQLPEFPGGSDSLMKFFKSQIRYPDSTKAHGLSGNVYVEFELNMTGMLIDSKVIKTIDSYTAEECLRAVNNMPPWTHGNTGLTGVSVRFLLPVRFVLKK